MSEPRTISRATARRFLVRRHFLAPPRSLPASPESVMTVIDRLGSLQFDPLEVAGRNHDLVLLARIDGYRREWTDRLLYEERRLFEAYNKGLSLLPTAELPWYRLSWDRARAIHEAAAFVEHGRLVEELLARIRAEGQLSSIDFESRPAIDWYWRPTNQVRAMLEALAEAGLLGLSGRRGNRRYYDLAERLFPPALLSVRPDEPDQRKHKLLSRYRAHGLLGRTASAEVFSGIAARAVGNGKSGATRAQLLAELVSSGSLVPVTIEGIRGEHFVVTAELPILDAVEHALAEPDPSLSGVAFLAPLDPLAWDRAFLRQLFDFDYRWEVYVPEAKRTWGYYVLPLLWGDRLVGRIEPRFDRRAGALRVLRLWWEEGFDPLADRRFVAALAAAIDAHRRFGGVGRVALPRTAGDRAVSRSLREALAAFGSKANVADDARP